MREIRFMNVYYTVALVAQIFLLAWFLEEATCMGVDIRVDTFAASLAFTLFAVVVGWVLSSKVNRA